MTEQEKLICGCGRPLAPVLDESGEQIGITHTAEDEDWHYEYFSGMKILVYNAN